MSSTAHPGSKKPTQKQGQKVEEKRESALGERQTAREFPDAMACGWFQTPFLWFEQAAEEVAEEFNKLSGKPSVH